MWVVVFHDERFKYYANDYKGLKVKALSWEAGGMICPVMDVARSGMDRKARGSN